MGATFPHDFPPAASNALSVIEKADGQVFDTLVNLVQLYWGNVDSINKSINTVWIPTRKQVIDSLNRMDVELRNRLMSEDAVDLWEGRARDEYVKWRLDFNIQTLQPIRDDMEALRGILHNAAGTVGAVRVRLVLVIIEVATVVVSAASGPEGWAATGLGLVGLLASWMEYEANVKKDLGEIANNMATLRDKSNIGRGPNALSLPFRSHIVSDWDNWENKDPKRATE
jgi:hypothetical protein